MKSVDWNGCIAASEIPWTRRTAPLAKAAGEGVLSSERLTLSAKSWMLLDVWRPDEDVLDV